MRACRPRARCCSAGSDARRCRTPCMHPSRRTSHRARARGRTARSRGRCGNDLRRDRLFGKRLAAANEISHLVDARLGALDQSAALRFVRRVVQRQVVLGHENRCEAAKAQPTPAHSFCA